MTDVTEQNSEGSLSRIVSSGLPRRDFLRFTLVAGLATPIGLGLAGCATGGGSTGSGAPTVAGAAKSATNPFGIDPKATVDVVIFKGGYSDQYAIDAGKTYDTTWTGSGLAKVTSTTKINTELQPRFVGGNPPDVIDNSGADSISFAGIQGQVEPLDDLLEAPAIGFPGKKIKDILIPGATDPGTFDGKLLQLNYFYTVYSLWYGAKLFKDNGFTPPTTWDETMALGEAAKAKGISLFVFGGQNAASYYHEFALSMAVRQGGVDILKKLENLDSDGYTQEPVMTAFQSIEKAVKAGYFLPGGSGMIHTQAQTQFVQGKALLYPSGSWLENEMKDITGPDFAMTSLQVPALAASPKLVKGFHGAAGEPFIVPKGKNPAGGKEFLRNMLSKEAASNTSKLVKAATIVTGTVPADGFGSTALASATKIQNDGLSEVYNWRYDSFYGMGKQVVTIWNTFLSGGMTSADLAKQLQGLSDKVKADPSVKKYTVS
ncbi:N-acetylglucosamine/diacetylchitobiose ABC transporter substrate-binding protein [Lapillicoccus sp.]|uniref:N-acetylglucosamine/diacetylchitobiose ABC transporter substrate-binding protein n=1 Tax=Lapillicoccus sp. TaxID=1909287 RepID=UPI0025E751BE|nr:N-acetylglucosamine/diacetylchitobiose ABC transporter substrate-binding protein [Lapillicoccus sp.]